MIFKFLKIFTYLLFSISTMLSPFIYPDKERKTSISKPGDKWESVIMVVELLFTITVCIVGIVLITFKYHNLAWISISIFIPSGLVYIVGAYMSIGIIENVMRTEKTGKLSATENWAIRTVAYTLFLLDSICKTPSSLLSLATHITNAPISDLIYITIYVLFLFLYLFLSCALLPIPLSILAKLMIRLDTFINSKLHIFKIGDFFIDQIGKQKVKHSLLILAINAVRNKRNILYALVLIFSPIFLLIDIFLEIAKIFWILFSMLVGFSFLLIKRVKHTIGKITNWVFNLSEYHVVTISFRLALIAALTIAVIHNRYTPLFKEYESSTGAFEFVASAILIPVILEWISSGKQKQQQK